MQEIEIYDFDFNLLGKEAKCVLFEWDTRYNSIGSFEGVFTLDSEIYNICADKDFLICVQGENQGIITSVRIEKDRIVISGKSMNFILSKRVALPFSTKDSGGAKSAIEVVCGLVRQYCGDFMEVTEPETSTEKDHFTKIEPKPLSEFVCDILATAGIGHFVKADILNKKWIFGCILPAQREILLSQPDKTLSDCAYVRYLSDYATSGVYHQQPYFMGNWDANTNTPALVDNEPSNFAKVYKVTTEGVCFNERFYQGDYVVCTNEKGKWARAEEYGYFWHKVTPKEGKGPEKWENLVLSCNDIEDATQTTLLNDIDENIVAIVQGVKKENYSMGDVINIQFGESKTKVFSKQIKRITYRFEWNNCFVRPTFYKIKEREDG